MELSPVSLSQDPGACAECPVNFPHPLGSGQAPTPAPGALQACSHLSRCQPGLSGCRSHGPPGTCSLLSASTHPAFAHLRSPYTALPTWAWWGGGSRDLLQHEGHLAHSQEPWPPVPRGHRGLPDLTVNSWAGPGPPAGQARRPRPGTPLVPAGSRLGARPPSVPVGVLNVVSRGHARRSKTWGGFPQWGRVLTWVRSTSLPWRTGCVSRARS